MATVAQLDVAITADPRGLQSGLAQADSAITKMTRNLAQAGLAMSAALTVPIVAIGKLGLEFNAMKETAIVAFTNMLGGAEKARDMFKSLVEFAAKTPFVIRDLVPATQKLLAAGIAAEKIIPTLAAIGDAASATGRGQEGIDRITNALIQMRNKGKVSAEEMVQQLGEMVPAMQIVAEGMGISTAELGERMKKGLLDVDKTIEILIEGFKKRFGGMMEEQSKTFTGALSNIADAVNSTLGSILEPMFNRLRDILLAVVPALGELQKWFQSLSPEVQNAAVAFAAVLAVAGPVALAIAGISAAISAIGVPIAAAVVAVGALAAAYTANFGGIRDLVDTTVKAITEWFNTHKADLVAIGEKVGEIAKTYGDSMRVMADAVTGLVKSVQVSNKEHESSWKSLLDMVLFAVDKFGKDLNSKMKTNALIFVVLTDALKRWVNDTKAQFLVVSAALTAFTIGWNKAVDGLIAPFRNALEWLQQNVSKFRAAFEAITTAARIGLVVKSPPIAAQWVEMIGAAAIKSAATTASAAPKFGDAFSSITAVANKHLPKIVGAVLEVGGAVVKVLESLKVKIPGVLGDVFGKIGSTSGAHAKQTGESIGGNLVDGFHSALESAAKTVGTTGSKTAGIVSSFVSATAAGIQAGLKFGPLAGAIVGGVSLLGGLFGALFKSPLQKAQEAAALQEAKDAIKLSIQRVLKGAQEVIQSATESFMKALEFFEGLEQFTAVRKAKFQEFWKAMTRLMNGFFELAKQFVNQSMPQLKAVAETIGPIADAISALPAAFDAISGHFGIAQSSIDNFFNDFSKLMDAFFVRSEVWIDGISKRAMKVANRLSPVVALISAFGTAMTDITGIKEPGDEMFAIFDRVIDKIVTHVANLSLKFDKAVLKTMANFAEKAGAALSIWKEAIESIKATVDIQAPSEQSVDNVVAGIELFINKLGGAVERLITTDLARITAFANTIAPIAAAIKAWAETAEVVRGYTAIAAEVWDQIVADFERGLVLLNLLILDAQLYVEKATTFKTLIEQGTSLIDAALRSFGSGISAAASALTGGLPAGGTSMSASAASTLAPMSAASGASSTTVVQPVVHVHVSNMIAHTQVPEFVERAIMDLYRSGRVSGSVFTGLAPAR